MPVVRKTVPLSQVAETILPHLLQSLKQREATTETQALTEAVTKGLITMLPRAWSADEHQYGGLPLAQVLEELKHLIAPLLVFMADHDALAILLKPYAALINNGHFLALETALDGTAQNDGVDSALQQSIAAAMSDMDDLGFSMDFDDDDVSEED